jgi:hypothetical protein
MAWVKNGTARSHTIDRNGRQLSGGEIADGALRAVRSALPQLWPVLLAIAALAAVNMSLQQTYKFLDADIRHLIPVVDRLALSALNALLLGIAIRILLGRGEGAWRLDRSLGAYTGLIVASDIVSEALELLYPQKALLQVHADQYWSGLGFAIAMSLLLWRIYLRLILWPIGELMGAPVTPFGSSHSMRGGVWPLLAATLLLTVPLALAGVLVKLGLGGRFPRLALGLGALCWGLLGIAMAAVAAEVYRRLIGQCAEPLSAESRKLRRHLHDRRGQGGQISLCPLAIPAAGEGRGPSARRPRR